MKKILLFMLIALLLGGCAEKQVSPEVQARRESREVAKKERDESMSAAKESREAANKARKESKAAKEAENKALHDKYDKVIIDNDVVKITLTTKMSAHNAMNCVIKNKTNKKITLIVFPTFITTHKSSEEIHNEHTDVFPRALEPNQETNSTFYVTFGNNAKLGINGYDDYFDNDNKLHFRTNIKVIESYDGDLDKVGDLMNNPLCDEFVEFEVYKAE